MKDSRIFDAEISAFFHSYLTFPKQDYNTFGTLTQQALRDAVHVLLTNRVFSSKEEMKSEALKDFGVILPNEIFIG
ncbi:hypothetical protein EQM14_01535 [Caproiciproducens sp. NJN-50]|uniref:hypothetical protein n=1 Tax=Caproiciproducens sp. NJN-50 TaxID=2507162 RepID=UPI000FFE2F7D|nr:hypothetical protein [Caproiciproducens sp. NJN-50]QAT48566.1 hypothetical protein EQM14_01535 [Caproiciproducens sp. NJN-50]